MFMKTNKTAGTSKQSYDCYDCTLRPIKKIFGWIIDEIIEFFFFFFILSAHTLDKLKVFLASRIVLRTKWRFEFETQTPAAYASHKNAYCRSLIIRKWPN